MDERAYSVQGLAATNAAELECIRKQAAAAEGPKDPADKGEAGTPAEPTAKSSLQKLIEAVETHNGANHGPALPKQAEYNASGMFQGGVQNLSNGWDVRGNGSGWQQGSPANYLDVKPRQAPVPTNVPQTPQQIQQGAIQRAAGTTGAIPGGTALRQAAGDTVQYAAATPGTAAMSRPEPALPKQASANMESIVAIMASIK